MILDINILKFMSRYIYSIFILFYKHIKKKSINTLKFTLKP